MARQNTTVTPLSNMEVSSFCSQMAMILQSGMSSAEGLSLMLEEADSREEKELLEAMNETLTSTGSLYKAFRAAGVFPAYLLKMTQLGEAAGKTDDVMAALSAHYQREASIARSIKNALTYPLIMIFMMAVVILVLITKVMPVFNRLFLQLGSEMTGFSKALLDFGTAVTRFSMVFILILVLLAALILFASKTGVGRIMLGHMASRFAGVRNLSEKLAACRFASGMYLTLSSGMSPEEALSLSGELVSNGPFLNKLKLCRQQVAGGADLSKSLLEASVFSGLYARMTAIGSRTGVLDEVMNDIADRYQEDVEQTFTRIIAALEPALVIILSVIAGVILLSVMLPLAGIMSSL